jgi:peptidoglycan/LPS O-acetylase OafA/YrhL
LVRLPYVLVITGLLALLAVPPMKGLFDSFYVILVFPAVLVLALGSPPSVNVLKPVIWAGAISYPLYAIHVPLLRAAVRLLPKCSATVERGVFWVLAISCIFIAAWMMENAYDAPMRRWLRGKVSA